jgi:DNA-binding NarL/FixJ family response regulator
MGAAPVHEAVTVAEAHAQARASGPCDLAVLHLALPGSAGLDLITELRSQGWNQLVVLASSQQPTVVRAVFQAGAQAYLLSTATVATITDGIARVLTGGLYADPNVAPLLAAPTTPVESASRPLSLREIGVLELVADGQTNKQIGENLVLSALTIKSHLSRIGRKLGAGDRAHMVAKAIRAGIIR